MAFILLQSYLTAMVLGAATSQGEIRVERGVGSATVQCHTQSLPHPVLTFAYASQPFSI